MEVLLSFPVTTAADGSRHSALAERSAGSPPTDLTLASPLPPIRDLLQQSHARALCASIGPLWMDVSREQSWKTSHLNVWVIGD